MSPTSNFKRNVSELVTSSNNNKYSREEECRNSGVIIDRKVFIGNYTGNKWNDGSVKPYHEEIHKARHSNPYSRNCGRVKVQSSNYNSNNYNLLLKIEELCRRSREKLKNSIIVSVSYNSANRPKW